MLPDARQDQYYRPSASLLPARYSHGAFRLVQSKGLYYLRTESSASAEKVGEKVERVALKDAEVCSIENKDQCQACMV